MCMLAKDLPKSDIFCFNVFVKKKKAFILRFTEKSILCSSESLALMIISRGKYRLLSLFKPYATFLGWI